MFIKDLILLVASLLAVFIGAALMSGKNPEFRFLSLFEKHKNKELGFALILLSLFGLGYSLYSEIPMHPIFVLVGALNWTFFMTMGLRRPIHHNMLRNAEISLAILFIVWLALFDRRFQWVDLILLVGLVFWIFALTYKSLKNKTG